MEATHSKKTALLACLVLLCLQFLFPLSLKAAAQPLMMEAYGTLLEGQEVDQFGSGPEGGFELPFVVDACRCRETFEFAVTRVAERNSDRPGSALLPVSGRHPSAP